jgi:hypothetical protein
MVILSEVAADPLLRTDSSVRAATESKNLSDKSRIPERFFGPQDGPQNDKLTFRSGYTIGP